MFSYFLGEVVWFHELLSLALIKLFAFLIAFLIHICSASSTSNSSSLDKYKNFSSWYDYIIEAADIIDKRYPVKGMLVWKPYGFKALKLTMSILEEIFSEYGYEEAYFPMLVPEEVFSKEKDFLEGFSGETFVVERTIRKPLARKFLLRPTSETVMYYMFNLWIKSFRDLPLRLYQTVNVFRYETEHTRPILRVREIIRFNEAHTAHATAEDAEREIFRAIEIYSKFFDQLLIPYIILRTPKWDTFAGAVYNYDFYALMPDKRVIELGSVINLGQKFAKVFDIKYQKQDGTFEYVHQTCFGVSERLVGVIISIHGDNRGIIFPTHIAPIQIVIVPILYKGHEQKVLNKCEKVYKLLRDNKFRVTLDTSDKTPGEKYYYWELKGVPIRIEIGPKDIEENKITIVRRDTLDRIKVDENKLLENLNTLMRDINENLKEKASRWLFSNIYEAKSVDEAIKIYSEKSGIVKLPWCYRDECGLKMEEQTNLSALGFNLKEKADGTCAICGQQAKTYLYLGKKY